jgi:hypothetical protein
MPMRRPARQFCIMIIVAAVFSVSASADDVLAPASTRYADSQSGETPDFQKHLVPLLGRLGCNGRACHGSFQGRGGFQLSLFGYDFDMDHKGLMERLDVDDPAESYVLHKPTLTEPHEGGKRMDVGSWEYNMFLRWIQEGAAGTPVPQKLVRLEVIPAEINFSGAKQVQPLRAIAHWPDGTNEDVTCLCRFKSNDEAICTIDEEGRVTSGDPGDSHVVVFYDNGVVPVPVIRPVSDQAGPRYPQIATRTEIDRLVIEKLRKLGIVPSDVCDDAQFLRRVSLDMTGTLPTAAEVRDFLKDSSADKRARKVDELLSTPAYAAWWTTQLCDWTGCSNEQLNNANPSARQSGAQDWYDWIYARVSSNMPYDEICENIIVSHGQRPGEDYRAYSERMSGYARSSQTGFEDNEGLIYYWGRKNFNKSEDRAIGFAYTFMGTRIQCAQCHKHPFDVWTQSDFAEFEDFFDRVRFSPQGHDRAEFVAMTKELGVDQLKGNEQRKALSKAVEKGETIPFPDIVIQKPRGNRRSKPNASNGKANGGKARLLGEASVDLNSLEDPRTALMDWLRNSPTRLFAKAFVNRVWASYFNRGIVQPTDDLSRANPPCNEALLNYLAEGLIAHDYDMKWLHREICLSDTYQRSWRPNDTNAQDERNFSRAVPRRLPAEVALDTLTMATASDTEAATYRTRLEGHAITNPSPPRNAQNGMNYILAVFGRSMRESNCDCDRSSEASLLQTLFVRNDQDALKLLERRNGWLRQVAETYGLAMPSNSQKSAAEQRIADLEKQARRARKRNDTAAVKAIEKRLAAIRKDSRVPEAKAAPSKVRLPENQLIEEAYLRTLSRLPDQEERQIALVSLKESKDQQAALEDLMWVLINTKEFIVNH